MHKSVSIRFYSTGNILIIYTYFTLITQTLNHTIWKEWEINSNLDKHFEFEKEKWGKRKSNIATTYSRHLLHNHLVEITLLTSALCSNQEAINKKQLPGCISIHYAAILTTHTALFIDRRSIVVRNN